MKPIAGLLLCALLAACAAPASPRAPSPSPSIGVTFDCLPIYCSGGSEAAVLTAVAGLGYSVQRVRIGPIGPTCDGPFTLPTATCPLATDPLPTAYVTFAGTDRIAAVEVGTITGGQGFDSVIAFQVPPVGWSMP